MQQYLAIQSTFTRYKHLFYSIFVIMETTANIEKTKTQMRRGILELCVLSSLSQGEMYPSDIIKTLKDAQLLVVEGTLYPLLSRLKGEGFLQYRWEESASGPPRKYYRLTDGGEYFLHELRQTWEELVAAVALTTQKIPPILPKIPSQSPEPIQQQQNHYLKNNSHE